MINRREWLISIHRWQTTQQRANEIKVFQKCDSKMLLTSVFAQRALKVYLLFHTLSEQLSRCFKTGYFRLNLSLFVLLRIFDSCKIWMLILYTISVCLQFPRTGYKQQTETEHPAVCVTCQPAAKSWPFNRLYTEYSAWSKPNLRIVIRVILSNKCNSNTCPIINRSIATCILMHVRVHVCNHKFYNTRCTLLQNEINVCQITPLTTSVH
jgi:hypothetical protein